MKSATANWAVDNCGNLLFEIVVDEDDDEDDEDEVDIANNIGCDTSGEAREIEDGTKEDSEVDTGSNDGDEHKTEEEDDEEDDEEKNKQEDGGVEDMLDNEVVYKGELDNDNNDDDGGVVDTAADDGGVFDTTDDDGGVCFDTALDGDDTHVSEDDGDTNDPAITDDDNDDDDDANRGEVKTGGNVDETRDTVDVDIKIGCNDTAGVDTEDNSDDPISLLKFAVSNLSSLSVPNFIFVVLQ